MAELSSIYADARHYDLLAQYTAPHDLPFYRRQLDHIGGPVLELGCGTGRVALALAARGAEVTGLDRSAALLKLAQRKSRSSGHSVRWIEGDFTQLALGQTYRLIIIAYNAFNHLIELPDIRAFFTGVAEHLQPDGRLIIDTFNPDPARLCGDPEQRQRLLQYRDPYRGGAQVVLYEQNRYEPARQLNHITWRYLVEGEQVRVDTLAMRIFFPQELDALLALSGYHIEAKLGDYEGGAFTSRSSKQLLICRASSPR